MNILIMSYVQALNHTPTNPTHVIRIGNSFRVRDKVSFEHLKKSSFYKSINEYFFDYINPKELPEGMIMFNEGIALKMLRDFSLGMENCKDLLVHCSYGMNRSPAVALAFNDIFRLGENSFVLSKQYERLDWLVYETLINTAKSKDIK